MKIIILILGLCFSSVFGRSPVSPDEQAYVARRQIEINKSFAQQYGSGSSWREYIFGIRSPRIALCLSGGGCRATLQSLGGLVAAHDTGLLDLTMYVGALSGSTWAVMPWLASGKSLNEYVEHVQHRLTYSVLSHMYTVITKDTDKLHELNGNADDSLTTNDFYSGLLASIFLKRFIENPYDLTLDSLAKTTFAPEHKATHPYPIATAVSGGVDHNHHCFEFSPYSFGSVDNGYIPAAHLGSLFVNGDLKNPIQPPRLAWLMGVWGSAYAINGQRLFVELGLGKFPAKDFVLSLLPSAFKLGFVNSDTISDEHYLYFLKQNHFAPTIANPFFDLNQEGIVNWFLDRKTELAHLPQLPLVDAAHDLVWYTSPYDGSTRSFGMNLSIIPLLHPDRAIDVIIVLDSSAQLYGSPSLIAAALRAQELGLPFPKIDIDEVMNSQAKPRVFYGSSTTPTVVYIPCFSLSSEAVNGVVPNPDDGYASTTNFSYPKHESDKVISRGYAAVVASKKMIDDAIKHKLS